MNRNLVAWCFAFGVLTNGMVASAPLVQATETSRPDESSTPTTFGTDLFSKDSLDSVWSFADPNGNDELSLSARPGWLRFQVNSRDEDIWVDNRGGAPVLHRSIDGNGSFALETYVDLASANGGYPVLNSIGGLIVSDADGSMEESPFLLTLGLQHNWDGGTEVILQKPGHSFKWASPGANAAFLRLVRNGDSSTWSSYYKSHVNAAWQLLAEVSDQDLPRRQETSALQVGLLAKTWDSNVGEPAKIDFAYFGSPESPATEISTADSAPPSKTLENVDVAGLTPFCVSGKERNVLNGYGEAELLRQSRTGCLTHMWFGGDWPGYERTRIRIYVDGEQEPSIDMELGLGHGCGFGDSAAPWGGSKLGKTGHPSGFYNTYKIPFGAGIRVTAQRHADSPDGAAFWWIVRGTENLPVWLAGVRLPAGARLKLHKRIGHVAKPFEEFSLCDAKGSGALYQVTMAADGLRDTGNWKDISYLEAIVRAYINGQPRPLQLSSGLEDYFLGTYYFNRGRYANDLAGLTHLDEKTNRFSGYRFHDDDPLFFRDGLRLTCRCGEENGGRKLHDPPETEFTTYTWIYQW